MLYSYIICKYIYIILFEFRDLQAENPHKLCATSSLLETPVIVSGLGSGGQG